MLPRPKQETQQPQIEEPQEENMMEKIFADLNQQISDEPTNDQGSGKIT